MPGEQGWPLCSDIYIIKALEIYCFTNIRARWWLKTLSNSNHLRKNTKCFCKSEKWKTSVWIQKDSVCMGCALQWKFGKTDLPLLTQGEHVIANDEHQVESTWYSGLCTHLPLPLWQEGLGKKNAIEKSKVFQQKWCEIPHLVVK